MANLAAAARTLVLSDDPRAVVIDRQRKSIAFRLSDGRTRVLCHVGEVHRLGDNTEIDTALVASTQTITGFGSPAWEMTQADYRFFVLGTLNSGTPMVRYERGAHFIHFAAHDLQWTNDLGQIQLLATPAQTATALDTPESVRWNNVYGTGRHLRVEADAATLRKWLDLAAPLPTPTATIQAGGNPVLEFNEIIQLSSGLSVFVNGAEWNRRDTVPSVAEIEFRDAAGAVQFVFPAAMAYGARPTPPVVGVLRLKRQGNSLFVSSRIPYDWLQTASYPVHIDPTLNLQVGASADDSRMKSITNDSGRNVTSSGVCSITDITFPPGSHGSNDEYSAAARFTVTGPVSGDSVSSASFKMTATGNYNASPNVIALLVSAQAADNAGALTTTDGDLNITARPRSTAVSSVWDLTTTTANTEYTISITSVIQEIVNRAGWASGNAMVILVDTDTTCTVGEWQDFYSYDGSTTKAPKLDIVYGASGGVFQPVAPRYQGLPSAAHDRTSMW